MNRIRAHDAFLKDSRVGSREDVVKKLAAEFSLTKNTIYSWYKGTTPLGRRAGRVAVVPELLYVIGALLGDGCPYYWRGNFQVLLVGEEAFTQKFAWKLSQCIGRQVRHYKYGSKNAWFVKVGNAELFMLFKSIREDPGRLAHLIDLVGRPRGLEEFVEGFFDAEGCIKVIREPARKTPKICIDFTNTNLEYLQLVEKSLKERFGIAARYSVQKASPPNKEAYHLRIYRKEEVAKFLTEVRTTKLSEEKRRLAENWFSKGVAGKALTYSLPKSGIDV